MGIVTFRWSISYERQSHREKGDYDLEIAADVEIDISVDSPDSAREALEALREGNSRATVAGAVINPATGRPVSIGTVQQWEGVTRRGVYRQAAIPDWAWQQLQDLAVESLEMIDMDRARHEGAERVLTGIEAHAGHFAGLDIDDILDDLTMEEAGFGPVGGTRVAYDYATYHWEGLA